MSNQFVWRPHEISIAETVTHNQVILDNRLSTLRDVALTLLREVESLRVTEPVRHRVRLHDEVQRFEIELINSALSRARGNQTQAAEILGVKLPMPASMLGNRYIYSRLKERELAPPLAAYADLSFDCLDLFDDLRANVCPRSFVYNGRDNEVNFFAGYQRRIKALVERSQAEPLASNAAA